ncbi:MAG TPA: iron chelate uptake ABC transporter family permease subunit [Albidovulum sp.]|uniref:iron chelate uptake ABC transporter family permease subunit n=1 Tax=Albidovulum sp. TaxID=1872424 RepID=UPI002C7DE43E|nr:iron chelate uptake ABC transporter family permease subunit [Albidovulum sp.]
MPDAFLIHAALAGIGLMLAAGPLGAFVVWRRMAYMGDATAHAALLGAALALLADLPIALGTALVALAIASLVTVLSSRDRAADTILGVLAHSALAIGLVAISFAPQVRSDLSTFLFGDILTVSIADLAWIWGGAAIVLGLLAWRWNALLTATVNEELAQAAGLDPRRERFVLTVALALVVAVAIKVVGALLISAMLIVPAAAARSFARTPEGMALIAVLIGCASVLAGLWGSFIYDTPAGPSIVTAAAAAFAFSLAKGRRAR